MTGVQTCALPICNSNVSPDGKWLVFMVNTLTSEPGYGMGLGLLNLEEWEKSPYAQEWETPEDRKRRREANRR